jgi:hypothetical protein
MIENLELVSKIWSVLFFLLPIGFYQWFYKHNGWKDRLWSFVLIIIVEIIGYFSIMTFMEMK